MANVWAVNEGRAPTGGEPWASIPVSEAIRLFELKPSDHVSGPEDTPRFGDRTRDLWYLGRNIIVVEVEAAEGRKSNWKPGFYRSDVKPKDAMDRLIRRALVGVLGEEDVVRVESAPTTDSQGCDALKITVVLTPQAVQRLENGAVLDVLVMVQNSLREMDEAVTPIVEYATEAELAEDAGSRS